MFSRSLAVSVLLIVSTDLSAQQFKIDPKKSPQPGGGPDTAKSIIDRRTGQQSEANKLKQSLVEKPIRSINGLQLAQPWQTSREYPKAWKQITESRAKLADSGMTKKEKAVLDALDTPLKVDFDKTRFRDVLAYLSDKTSQVITVPETTLEEAEIDYDSRVTLKITKPQAMRSILRKVLRDHGLTYVVKDELILVVTPERARKMMVLRTYPVGDVVADLKDPNNKLLKKIHAEHLIRIIQAMIEPAMWDVNGGAATLLYDHHSECFILRAPGEVHLSLGAAGFVHRTK
jgi:hypothetical protein